MHCRILINGVVQGIGFRPFVYNIAQKHGLKGFILNKGDAGVEIQIKGDLSQIESFLEDLKKRKPTLARYESFKIDYDIHDSNLELSDKFRIAPSSLERSVEGSYIPPDLPICQKCLEEMFSDPRRKNYPFTSCVDCGPRYTVITSLPYDRPRTVMNKFPFCTDCLKEYKDPSDRRFHAQTTCCWKCGPRYYLSDKFGNLIIDKKNFQNEWQDIVKIIDEGSIIAIKGIGGTHLTCSTTKDDSILRLRRWKGARGNKPFAVMSPNIQKVLTYAKCSQNELEILQSLIRPILLLEKRKDFSLSPLISPGLHNIGVLLPYSGIHYMISENVNTPALIMTSGNPSNIPILIKNRTIKNQLGSVADYLLLHDREIYQRADDSVMRIHSSGKTTYPLIIRRSRGYIPEPIQIPSSSHCNITLALGAEMYNVGALGLGNRCFPTQHIGHMTTIENSDFFTATIDHMKRLFGINSFDAIGGDLHPQFLTTQMGQQLSSDLNIPFFQFQHHFSHLGALALDAKVNLDETIICVALDGTGYGVDGTIWGGEILLGNCLEYKRIAHLETQILLGGDQAISNPYRVLLSILLSRFSLEDVTQTLNKIPWLSWITKKQDYSDVVKLLEKYGTKKKLKGIHLTSSCGRLLDTISILLGAAKHRTYEGEPAIKLESLAEKSLGNSTEFNLNLPSRISKNGTIVIQTSPLIFDIWKRIQLGQNREKLALSAEKKIARTFAEIAIEIANKQGVSKIGMSGGVCYNQVIFREFYHCISKSGKHPIAHRQIPCGDGGVAIGQIPLILAKLI